MQINTTLRSLIFTAIAALLLAGCRSESDRAYSVAEKAYVNGEYERAIELFTEAAKLMPDNPAVYGNRANCHSYLGDIEAALADYETAIQKAVALAGSEDDPNMAYFYYNRGFACQRAERYQQAVQDYEKTIAVNPDYPDAKNNLAWILATCPSKKMRDPGRAVELARKECEKHEWKEAGLIDTLAAALAASGDFSKAVDMQKKALDLVSDDETRKDFQERLKLYQGKRPYYQKPKETAGPCHSPVGIAPGESLRPRLRLPAKAPA